MFEANAPWVAVHDVVYLDQPAQLVTIDDHRLIRRVPENRFVMLPHGFTYLPMTYTYGNSPAPTATACMLLRILLGNSGPRVGRYTAGHAYLHAARDHRGGAFAELYVYFGVGQTFDARAGDLDVRTDVEVWCRVGDVESHPHRNDVLTVYPEAIDEPQRSIHRMQHGPLFSTMRDYGRVLSPDWVELHQLSIDDGVVINLGPPMTADQVLAIMALTKGAGT